MRTMFGGFLFFLFCVYGGRYLVRNPDVLTSRSGWMAVLVTTGVVMWIIIPSVLDLLFRRKYGWGDGQCAECGGTGRARYELRKYGISEVCRTCKGSGSGAGGPGGPEEG